MPQFNPNFNVTYSGGHLLLGPGITVDAATGRLLVASTAGGTVTSITFGTGLSGGTIATTGTVGLLPPLAGNIGGVKAGANVTISPDGTISVASPGIGTITGVVAGTGLNGGGLSGTVTLNANVATSAVAGIVRVGPSLTINAGQIDVPSASLSGRGVIQLATSQQVVDGNNGSLAVTPLTLRDKIATTGGAFGLTTLSDATDSSSSTQAATSKAVKTVADSVIAALAVANTKLPLAGGTMAGDIVFSPTQTFPGVSVAPATRVTRGTVSIGNGLNITAQGELSSVNLGTVTSIQAGPGLGAPVSGNLITTSGTIRLLPPTATTLGGVRAGTNISIGADGVISADQVVRTNNPYSYNSYIWPIPTSPGIAPGQNGSVLTLLDKVTGQVGWRSQCGVNGTVTQIDTGVGLMGGPITTVGTVYLSDTTVIPGTYLNADVTVDQQGRITQICDGASTGTGTVTRVNTGTGLTGGPIISVGTVSLANTAVAAGDYTYGSFTVDPQGRLTAAASGDTPVTSVATGTGLTGGPITSTGTISLANSGVTPGVYANANITVNAQGQIIAAASGTAVQNVSVTAPLTKTGANNNPTLGVSAATSTDLGVVRPDNTTVTVDANGVLSAAGAAGGSFLFLTTTPAPNGTATVFGMSSLGVPYSPSANNLLVFVGGVPQVPGLHYNFTGSTLTFATAPPNSTSMIIVTVA